MDHVIATPSYSAVRTTHSRPARPLQAVPADSPGSSAPERPHAASHRTDHDQADRLLISLASCQTERRRHALEDEIVRLTLDIADYAARRYSGRGVELDDLTQVARLALVKAVRGYRPGRGPCFAAYAVPTVIGEIKRHFRDIGWTIRPPRAVQETRLGVATREEEMRHELKREPTTREVAAALGVSRHAVDEAREAGSGFRPTSLEGASEGGAPVQVADHMDAFAELDVRDALGHALATLTPRERHILHLRFIEELTQSDIGRAIGVSQMQVSRLLTGTIARLRATMEAADQVA